MVEQHGYHGESCGNEEGWELPFSGFYAIPEHVTEPECRSQGLRIVSESGAGLGGLTEEAHPMHRMFPDTNVY